MKLLIVDDNKALTRNMKEFFGREFVIDTAATAEEGLYQATHAENDIILLDLGLPDAPGEKVCTQIRSAGVTTPIMVLTATSDVRSRVDLLNGGADDYLMKPFALVELRARIKALLRRRPLSYTDGTLNVRDLSIDPYRRRVSRAGQDITLRRKEFDILEYLVRNSGRAVTRPMIFNHVWEAGKDSWHNTVDVHIKHLRDKVDRPFDVPLIKTAYGIGYTIDDK
ncbi:MAG TPA: response regulator transcription factor [Candidatus Saccharimonadales bacterium]|nr:response regulator transcription factor [Candidatus Saccharimonadales bacterium]